MMLVMIGYIKGWEVEAEIIIIEKIHSFKLRESILSSKLIVLCLKLSPETCLWFSKKYEAIKKILFIDMASFVTSDFQYSIP